MSNMIAIPAHILTALIGMANSYVEDIESGLNDGTYDAADNLDFPEKKEQVELAEKILAKGCSSSVDVRYWDCYSDPSCVNTHQIDIDDQRLSSGQIYLDVGAKEGNLDDILGISVEVNTNPLNGIDHVPCAHIHFDGDALAVSLFKIGTRILVRPETNVTIEPISHAVTGVNESLYWIE